MQSGQNSRRRDPGAWSNVQRLYSHRRLVPVLCNHSAAMQSPADGMKTPSSVTRLAAGPTASLLRAIDELWTHEGMTPRERMLAVLWDRYVDEEYADADGGDRHMHYDLELFASRYPREILMPRGETSLRVEFLGFLRALFARGCVNSVDVVCVMRCLDGASPAAARMWYTGIGRN